ncbi:hypothetical protein [Streptomyces prasinopilosus]|uniref:hypothetical protein n=1 Tax=Streptomyces prasinopilosus TaxID=67344 RepID=UPI0015868AAD|nr:hypothetical protein [Streptomyces prasinopilosus]
MATLRTLNHRGSPPQDMPHVLMPAAGRRPWEGQNDDGPRVGAHGTVARASGKPRLVAFLLQRADFLDEFSNSSGSQTRAPLFADDHRTRRVPTTRP